MTLITRSRGRNRSFGTFSPSSLFLGGIQGAWYDPSDNATMYQDAAGTTPVTAVEQPVGLVFDKRTAVVPRRNLLTYSEQFDNAAWATLNASISANVTTAPDGTTTADAIIENTSSGLHLAYYIGAPLVAGVNCASVYVKAAGRNFAILRITNPAVSISVNLTTLVAVATEGTPVGTTVTDAGNGWRRISFSATQVGIGQIQVWASIDGTINSYTGDGTSGVYIWGAQLEVGSTASTYQKIVSGIGGEWTPGNHAYQATAASRPVLRARYNLLTYSEQFDNAAWTKSTSTVSANVAVAPDGTTTADLIYPSGNFAYSGAYQSVSATGIVTGSIYAKASGFTWLYIIGAAGAGGTGAWFNLATGTVGTVTAGHSATIQSVGNGWYRCTLTSPSGSFHQFAVADSDGSITVTASGTNGIFVWGAQLLTVTDATATGNAYQRIEGAATYATGGVFRPYLAFDGVDDGLATNAVDFTATNKMSVWSGHTRLTTSLGPFVGISSSVAASPTATPGSFLLAYNWSAAASIYNFYLYGTTLTGFTTPSTGMPTDVVAMSLDIGGATRADNIRPRVNGTVPTLTPSDNPSAGSGNFSNNIIVIGSAAGFWMQGRIYGLIVRGAASSATEVAQTESWLNQRTGAY